MRAVHRSAEADRELLAPRNSAGGQRCVLLVCSILLSLELAQVAAVPTGSPVGVAPTERSEPASVEPQEDDRATVCIDAAHRNMHRADGTYAALAEELEGAGFRVRDSGFILRPDSLDRCSVLIVANALHERNYVRGGGDWSLPAPSAFSVPEIEAVRAWVNEGGGLLLIADHMPLPGAARDLASAFGVHFLNGFAVDTSRGDNEWGRYTGSGRLVFRRAEGTLASHPITDGNGPVQRLDSVTTYTGQAFVAPSDFRPLLVVPNSTILLLPRIAWEFPPGTPTLDAGGWLQGAAASYGSGRVVMLGEAAAFRPRDDGELPGQNDMFGIGIVRWLTGSGESGRK